MEKYMNRKVITSNEFRGYKINNGENNNLFCHKKTLDHIADTTEYMTNNHSRTLMVRLDIQPDQDSEHTLSSKDMTRVIENVKRQTDSRFKNRKNDPDTHVVWVSEKTTPDDKPHYHLAIFVNGNAIQNGYSLKEAFNNEVKKKLKTDKDGLVNFSSSNGKVGKLIERNSPDFEHQVNDAVHAASYLAKTRSKEYNPKGSRVSSCTRIRRK